MSIPSSMQAVVINNDTAVVQEVHVPQPGPNQALVKVRAVAINPTDYKHIDYKLGPNGSVLGCDYAGEIVLLGNKSSSDFSVGDTICGLLHGASNDTPETGAFAEYAVVDLPTATKLNMKAASSNELAAGKVETFQGAASLPCAMYTAAQVLTFHLGNKLLWQPNEPQNNHPLLIWGGATSCGQYAIQLAKKMNAYTKIIAVASKKHESLLKKYGADDLFDYHDTNIEEKIKEKYPNILHVLDAASFPHTIRSIHKLVPSDKPVHIVHLGRVLDDAIPENERKTNVKLTWPILYLISGHDEKLGPHVMKALPEYRESIISFINFITPRLADGSILHMPLKNEEGLKSIPALIEQVRKGNTNGSKLIATLQ